MTTITFDTLKYTERLEKPEYLESMPRLKLKH